MRWNPKQQPLDCSFMSTFDCTLSSYTHQQWALLGIDICLQSACRWIKERLIVCTPPQRQTARHTHKHSAYHAGKTSWDISLNWSQGGVLYEWGLPNKLDKGETRNTTCPEDTTYLLNKQKPELTLVIRQDCTLELTRVSPQRQFCISRTVKWWTQAH